MLRIVIASTSLIACAPELQHKERFVVDASGGVAAVAFDVDASTVPAPPAACPDVPQLLVRSCATASCHTTKEHAADLDLEAEALDYRLFGVLAVGGGGMLIDPLGPDRSVVYTKMTATPPFGARMPIGAPPLEPAAMACVRAWVIDVAMGTKGPDGGVEPDTGDGGRADSGPG